MTAIPEYLRIVLSVLAMVPNGNAIDRAETICLAKAVYFEVRDQDIKSQVAIASFMHQFAERNDLTICEEIYETPGVRYPWANADSIDLSNQFEKAAWKRSVKIAALTLNGSLAQDVGKATHFLTPSIIKKLPKWYDPERVVYRVGVMEFLRLPDYL